MQLPPMSLLVILNSPIRPHQQLQIGTECAFKYIIYYLSWNYLSHEDATSTVYKFGEDGLFGISDDRCLFCACLGVWNGVDPIIKERLFGLTGPQGNHGEDVKELYYYLDNMPDHEYMKALYKYPQSEFPYQLLKDENKERTCKETEYEILDTGVFDEEKGYWDITVEYAKDVSGSIVCCYTVYNKGLSEATIHVLPQFWFRNTWCSCSSGDTKCQKPSVSKVCVDSIEIKYELGNFTIQFSKADDKSKPVLLFTENEDGDTSSPTASDDMYFKDAFHKILINGCDLINRKQIGTKCAAVYKLTVPPGGSQCVYWTLYPSGYSSKRLGISSHVSNIVEARKRKSDIFYDEILPQYLSKEEKNVARQAYAGLLWNKQYYYYDVQKWRDSPVVYKGDNSVDIQDENGDGNVPFYSRQSYITCIEKDNKVKEEKSAKILMQERFLGDDDSEHVENTSSEAEINITEKVSKTEATSVEMESAELKSSENSDTSDVEQLETDSDSEPDFVDIEVICKEYVPERINKEWQHMKNHDIISMPDKWEFPWCVICCSDRNIKVTDRVHIPAFEFDFGAVNPPIHGWSCLKVFRNTGSTDFTFLKKWINKHDPNNKYIFDGGFLGLDNISVLDRGRQLPQGITLEQADATGWMAFYSLTMLEMCLELSRDDPVYCDLSIKYLNHFNRIATALNESIQNGGKLKSLVGVVPVFACSVLSPELISIYPELVSHLSLMCQENSPYIYRTKDGHYLLTVVPVDRLKKIFHVLLNEKEFLSQYGIRSLSQIYQHESFCFKFGKKKVTVNYCPGESDCNMYGGNSNWRGPIWLSMNYMIVDSLQTYYKAFNSGFKIPCPSNCPDSSDMSLMELIKDISRRISTIFLPDSSGRRPLHGTYDVYTKDPDWSNLLLFYEYFHANTGRGCGASNFSPDRLDCACYRISEIHLQMITRKLEQK
ncbi:hypothetical protein KUTeg_009857 [Tegillarca granosa]|uniref:Glycosyl hydrolase family 63 C-terminal domain-containing protein n=1 Tax=Tegillarca granosa TaxID=220873 RepID=A0ABQ9F526_TEGGR|nr:hypothetical protein KUTeg_009857 [Tegillarca granosa]